MKEKIDVALISPPVVLDEFYRKSLNFRRDKVNIRPPLALSCLAEYLKYRVPSLRVKILDGGMSSLDGIKKKIGQFKAILCRRYSNGF